MDVTGRAISSGEASDKVAIREVYEELEIKIDNYNITLNKKEIFEGENDMCVINLTEKDFKILIILKLMI